MTEKSIEKKECAVPAKVRPENFVKPRYRVKSGKEAFELYVVMPGVSKKDFNVSLENDRLTITGTPHCEVPESWRVVHEELVRGPYRLELELHRDIDERGISAKVKEGVLTLKLPLRETVKPRLIDVR
jgi:HSP20 family protein